MEKKTILTSEGLKKLEEELKVLLSKRKDIAEKIKVARSFGDLSENSEYDEAKNEQAKIEGRISQLDRMLKNFVIIDSNELTNDRVQVGSVVKIQNLQTNKVSTYRIVGSMETNPEEGKISDESPVGKALLGNGINEIAKVETPSGVVEYEILEIGR